MPEIDETSIQKGLHESKGTETKAISTLGKEGEIPCIVVHSDRKHVEYINNIINRIQKLLPQNGFKLKLLSDEIKPFERYGKTFEQLAEECALGIVILDGLRPNILVELGILMGKNKPIIPLQDEKAVVAVKSFYQQDCKNAGLTPRKFEDLKEPFLGFFSHISDLQGLHVETVNKDASLNDPKYPANVIDQSIKKLMPKIIEEYNKLSLKSIGDGEIRSDYFQRFYNVALKISEYYGRKKKFSVKDIKDIEDSIKEIRDLESDSGTDMPSQVYRTIASLYLSLAEETEWKDVHKIVNYYNRSLEIYERILEFESNPALKSETYKKIGDVYWKLSEYRDKNENCNRAIEDYNRAIELDPKFIDAYNNRGNAYDKKGEHDRAIEDYNKAIKLDPKDARAYSNRGLAYYYKEEYDRAIKDYNKAIELDPKYTYAYNNRGLAYDNKGEHDRAIEDYTEGIKLDPNDARAYYSRGDAYYNKGEYDRAIKDYNKAIKLDPKYVDAYNNRGNAYDDKGEYDRAIKNYNKAIELDPKYAMVYYNRGIAYENKGEYDRAIEDYNRAIELDPMYTGAYTNRGNTYDNKGEHDRAIEDYNEAIRLDPNDAMAYYNRGIAYYKKGEYDRAIKDYDKAIELDPKHVLTYYSRGLAYDKRGEHNRAIKDYNETIELLDPNDAIAYNDLEGLLRYLNEHEELIPEKWDTSPIEQAIKGSGLKKDQKDSIISLLKSLETL